MYLKNGNWQWDDFVTLRVVWFPPCPRHERVGSISKRMDGYMRRMVHTEDKWIWNWSNYPSQCVQSRCCESLYYKHTLSTLSSRLELRSLSSSWHSYELPVLHHCTALGPTAASEHVKRSAEHKEQSKLAVPGKGQVCLGQSSSVFVDRTIMCQVVTESLIELQRMYRKSNLNIGIVMVRTQIIIRPLFYYLFCSDQSRKHFVFIEA